MRCSEAATALLGFQSYRVRTNPAVQIERTRSSLGRQGASECSVILSGASAVQIRFSTPAYVGDLLAKLQTRSDNIGVILKQYDWPPEQFKKLILDGFLQIEAGGEQCSGIDAVYPLELPDIDTSSLKGNAQLSFEALRYAAALNCEDAAKLSAKLYFYNRVPVKLALRRMLDTTEALLKFATQSCSPSDLHWAYVPPGLDRPWHHWTSRWREIGRKIGSFKLYVCPTPDGFCTTFNEVLKVVDESGATGFKIPSDVFGLHRPDKIVVYFPELRMLKRFAERLGHYVSGFAVQPVPFTADLGRGMLSWGLDPPNPPTKTDSEQMSWRTLICDTLARAIIMSGAGGITAAEFALQRIRLDGIDPFTWAPNECPE
jgi:hypothetical protein